MLEEPYSVELELYLSGNNEKNDNDTQLFSIFLSNSLFHDVTSIAVENKSSSNSDQHLIDALKGYGPRQVCQYQVSRLLLEVFLILKILACNFSSRQMISFGFAKIAKRTRHVYYVMHAFKSLHMLDTKYTFITQLREDVVTAVITMHGILQDSAFTTVNAMLTQCSIYL